ncbi:SMODS domain-containing nucleotidyltransferase [Pseudomonas putida]|uniref:Nucleotidyltransferase n=1 Tax=Pseudomonas putida TaxID=303 RepID=A0A2C5VHB8_PSEPU|nr:nucleotidyltransferase [Pseudomonas putida]PHH43979.1 nucleotidyltransferase [Pseudomonas putida]
MATQQQFIDFLKEIEPSPTTKSICISAHSTLREKLEKHETYRDFYVSTYLSGSYARNTALRPRVANGTLRRPDVDIILVTNHTLQDLPSDVITTLRKAVKSLGYAEVDANRRSICVSLESIEMDVVPVIANPWQEGGWLIADKSEERWLVTNPMGHNQWASSVNKKANGYFVPLVKLVKWWRRENLPHLRRPKGFILETLVAEHMDYSETSYEELFAKFLEAVRDEYEWMVQAEQVPYLQDPSVPGNNVFSRVKPEEFKRFYDMIDAHAKLVRRAQSETDADKALTIWQKVFGDRFRQPVQKASMLRTATVAGSGMGLTFPAIAVVPPNKPQGFA